MVVSALVDAPPGLIRGRRSPVLAAIATGIPAGAAAAIARAATRPARSAPATWALLGSTWPTRASGTSLVAAGAARPTRTLLGSTGTLLGSTGPALTAWPLATLETTGRRTGLRRRNTGTQAQTTKTHCDRYRATAGHTLDIHHEHPFEAFNDPLIHPDRRRLCSEAMCQLSLAYDCCGWSHATDTRDTPHGVDSEENPQKAGWAPTVPDGPAALSASETTPHFC
jgi:hypothetical protein